MKAALFSLFVTAFAYDDYVLTQGESCKERWVEPLGQAGADQCMAFCQAQPECKGFTYYSDVVSSDKHRSCMLCSSEKSGPSINDSAEYYKKIPAGSQGWGGRTIWTRVEVEASQGALKTCLANLQASHDTAATHSQRAQKAEEALAAATSEHSAKLEQLTEDLAVEKLALEMMAEDNYHNEKQKKELENRLETDTAELKRTLEEVRSEHERVVTEKQTVVQENSKMKEANTVSERRIAELEAQVSLLMEAGAGHEESLQAKEEALATAEKERLAWEEKLKKEHTAEIAAIQASAKETQTELEKCKNPSPEKEKEVEVVIAEVAKETEQLQEAIATKNTDEELGSSACKLEVQPYPGHEDGVVKRKGGNGRSACRNANGNVQHVKKVDGNLEKCITGEGCLLICVKRCEKQDKDIIAVAEVANKLEKEATKESDLASELNNKKVADEAEKATLDAAQANEQLARERDQRIMVADTLTNEVQGTSSGGAPSPSPEVTHVAAPKVIKRKPSTTSGEKKQSTLAPISEKKPSPPAAPSAPAVASMDVAGNCPGGKGQKLWDAIFKKYKGRSDHGEAGPTPGEMDAFRAAVCTTGASCKPRGKEMVSFDGPPPSSDNTYLKALFGMSDCVTKVAPKGDKFCKATGGKQFLANVAADMC